MAHTGNCFPHQSLKCSTVCFVETHMDTLTHTCVCERESVCRTIHFGGNWQVPHWFSLTDSLQQVQLGDNRRVFNLQCVCA